MRALSRVLAGGAVLLVVCLETGPVMSAESQALPGPDRIEMGRLDTGSVVSFDPNLFKELSTRPTTSR